MKTIKGHLMFFVVLLFLIYIQHVRALPKLVDIWGDAVYSGNNLFNSSAISVNSSGKAVKGARGEYNN